MTNANDATVQVRLSSERRDQWDEHAEELTNGNRSDFIKSMVEAGRKKFDADVQRDEPTDEIRRERNRLRRENENLRTENERLLNRLDTTGERGAVLSFLADHGQEGATFDALLEHVSGGVTERLNQHIDRLKAQGAIEADPAPEDTSKVKLSMKPSEARYRATDADEAPPRREGGQ